MKIYSEDPDYFTNMFSTEFEEEFMNIIKQKYTSKPVLPNRVYIELIKNIEHVHMNGTKWTKLSEFIEVANFSLISTWKQKKESKQ